MNLCGTPKMSPLERFKAVFWEKLPKKGLILDFGCGSGRDSLRVFEGGI